MSHARSGSFSSKCGCRGLIDPIDEGRFGANDDRRDAKLLGVPGGISPSSEELEDFLPSTRPGAGEDARLRLAVLELRRRDCGRGEDGVSAVGSPGECRPGDASHWLLEFACSERRFAEREREFVSLLLYREGPRDMLLLPAPGDDNDCWLLCISAKSQRVASRLCLASLVFWWGVSVVKGVSS